MLAFDFKSRSKKVLTQELIDGFKESLGEEGAMELVKNATQKAGLTFQKEYTKEEAIKILNVLQDEEGFIGILAGILIPRFIIRK